MSGQLIKHFGLVVFCSMVSLSAVLAGQKTDSKPREFKAVGPTQPVKLQRSQFKGAIKVSFDLLPTSMSFDLPWNYCMVTQNGIKFSTLAAETYDPRDFDGTGGAASFEPGMDREGRYVRAWIEHQSDARIVVRIRYALANNLYDIAFPDIPSGSPYGKGDWVDEWFYIYPDGVHTRHMKIYTGLAPVSRPFGFDREPPNVVHEFMELNVRGLPGHKPTDDIEIEALTLIRLLGSHSEAVIPAGISKKISYKPYPDGFGEFRDASIILLNLKSEYKPFTIGLPYGVRVQPYSPEDALPHVFQTWGYSERRGYSSSLGHMLNFWHYRRTDNTLEQVYLHGMTSAENPVKQLVPLAWSWVVAPRLQMEGFKPDYGVYTYDTAQKAYIVPRKGRGPASLEFELETEDEDEEEIEELREDLEEIEEEIDSIRAGIHALREEISEARQEGDEEAVEDLQEEMEDLQKEMKELREQAEEIEQRIDEEGEDDDTDTTSWIINPAVIVKDWDEPGVELKLDGKTIEQGKDFRVGYEQTPTGKDLVIWLKMKSDKTVTFSLSPGKK